MEHRKQGLQTLLVFALGVLFASGLFATGLFGQSLADLARQSRARSSRQSAGGRVFTNADVSTSAPAPPAPAPAAAGAAGAARPAGQAAPGATQAAAGQQPGQAAAGQPAAGAGQPAAGRPGGAAAGTEPAEKTPAELEKEYRAKFAELRENLALEERKADILQRELNLMSNQYYSDPAATLQQEYTRSNLNNRTAEIQTQKAAVEKAKQAIAALEEELRVKSLPAGWAR